MADSNDRKTVIAESRRFKAGDDVRDLSTDTTWKVWSVNDVGHCMLYNLFGAVTVAPAWRLKFYDND